MNKILQSYLKFWAIIYLKRACPKIIGITGSVGKTSAKEAIFSVLKYRYSHHVRKTEGNLNTETGVPMTILGFSKRINSVLDWFPVILLAPFKSFVLPKVRFLVLEMAADKPGDIKYLTSFVKPDIAVLTAIGPSHLKSFGKMEKILEEKAALLWALPPNGWSVLNIDDENVRKASYGGRWQKMTYAINQVADLVAKNIRTEIIENNAKTQFQITGKESLKIESLTLGNKANIYAALAATAVGKILEVPTLQIKRGLEKMKSQEHRMQIVQGINNSLIIDDSYNANPLSMDAALNTLSELKAKRKIIILGDMKELGKISPEAHTVIGRKARKVSSFVVAIGQSAKYYRGKKYFKTNSLAIDYLLKEVRSGDILLIKASRAQKLDEVVEALKEK